MGGPREPETRYPRELAERLKAACSGLLSDSDANQLSEESFSYVRDLARRQQADPFLALVILTVSAPSIQFESAYGDWERVVAMGIHSIASSGVIYAQLAGEPSIEFEREIALYVAGGLRMATWAATKAGAPVMAILLSGHMVGRALIPRQFVEWSDQSGQRAWDIAAGRGVVDLRDDQPRKGKSHVGSAGVPSSLSAFEKVRLVLGVHRWAKRSRDALDAASVQNIRYHWGATGYDNEAAQWAELVNAVERVAPLRASERFIQSTALCLRALLAAKESGRDVVQIHASRRGVAVTRIRGGEGFRARPQMIELNSQSLAAVQRLVEDLGVAISGTASLRDCSDLHDELRVSTWTGVLEPILSAWSDIGRMSIIPSGWVQDLPLTAAWAAFGSPSLDLTIAPDAGTLLTANHQPVPLGGVAAILGDPGEGSDRLDWVVDEMHRVATVYSRSPDLVVERTESTSAKVSFRFRDGPQSMPVDAAPDEVLRIIAPAGIVHLACHGWVPDGTGTPELHLAGRIGLEQLDLHRFRAGACVVLSACSVGRVGSADSLSLYGFPAMLLSTGARSVIASTLPIPDCEATVQFMQDLHIELAGGALPGRALLSAMQQAISSGAPSAVWGSFQAFGA